MADKTAPLTDVAPPLKDLRDTTALDLVSGVTRQMPAAQLTGDQAAANDLLLYDGAKWVPDHTVYETVAAATASLALKADIASPTFTGDPKAPTPAPGDNDTSLATTAFVAASFETVAHAAATYAPLAGATFTGPVVVGKLNGTVLNPTTLSANQDNYNPANLATATILHLTTDASRDLTGLQGGTSGRVLLIRNDGANPLVLKHNSGSSSSGNQFILPQARDFTLSPSYGAVMFYANTFWYLIGAPATGRGTSSTTPGAVTTIAIAHGLGSTPSGFTAQPANGNASTAVQALGVYLTADATNVTLTFSAALTPATTYDFVWTATL